MRRGEDARIPKRGSFLNRAAEDLEKFRRDWRINPTPPTSKLSPFSIESTVWIIDYGPATSHWSSDPDVITLCIDLAGPNHEILRQVAGRIERARSKQPFAKSHSSKRKRHRFEHYGDYVRAFDLHKLGKTDREIAAEVFNGMTVSEPAKRISEYRNKARLLIKDVERGIW